MDRIERFRIFARVVECASFTRAANMLGLSRPSVSAAIQELEAHVGARLLHRTTRKVVPTQDGAALYERSLRLIADFEETEGFFRQTTEGPAGWLTVNVPGRIGRLIVVPALPDFLARYPAIDVSLGVTDRAVNLVEDGVDCVLRVGPLNDSGLIARSVGDLPLINVASPAYLRTYGAPKTPSELTRHLAVNYASPSNDRVEEWEWIERGKPRTMALRARITVNNAEAYIGACLAGLGLIQTPAYDVKMYLAKGELVEVMPDHRAAPMPMTLLYLHRPLSRRLRVLLDWLHTLLRRELLS
jgi:LysR family transcriptional regulator for bpeEF and oprC